MSFFLYADGNSTIYIIKEKLYEIFLSKLAEKKSSQVVRLIERTRIIADCLLVWFVTDIKKQNLSLNFIKIKICSIISSFHLQVSSYTLKFMHVKIRLFQNVCIH